MLTRITLRLIVVIVALGCAGVAFSQDRVHEYFNDTARKVQATENPIQKREILSKSLVDMTKVLDTVKNAPLTSDAGRRQLGPRQSHPSRKK